ncbi:nuclease-related domain-containing protein [Salinibacillus xinjiangensis]|uniref:NERD domain-containing protein n=1 Tax=Salinibacillus xinjiangensis TaxID=1229268 RepID=A0A6G1X8R2_9BACI|nr:nuclease-related domain-containing protein [Salinibacillus xinjiangensis]MRG87393.1 NERD domain-containing protein [Salinibacillus xinjiangensis]
MLVLNHAVSMRIKKLQALLRRLPDNHPKRPAIEEELGKCVAGQKGEKSLDYYLSFLPEKEFLILHGLRLPYQSFYFQMDTILLSKSFILIVEAKNISGHLLFDDTFKQLIRTKDDGTREVFPDPLQQVKHQKFQFHNWLKEHKFPNIPLEHLVVMTNPNCILKTTNPESVYVKKVLHSTYLLEKIEQIQQSYIKEAATNKQIHNLSKRLMKRNEPEDPDFFDKFNMVKSELIPGVQCPSCSTSPMFRKNGKWQCPQCPTSSRDAHMQALIDYSLLIDNSLTNREARKYLQIESPTVSYKILRSLNTQYQGSTKSRVYDLKF